MANVISAAFPYQKQRRRVLGSEMAYVEVGEGDPIVLLHGNPTSSYLWRNVWRFLAPKLAESHTVICVDLRASAAAGYPVLRTTTVLIQSAQWRRNWLA